MIHPRPLTAEQAMHRIRKIVQSFRGRRNEALLLEYLLDESEQWSSRAERLEDAELNRPLRKPR